MYKLITLFVLLLILSSCQPGLTELIDLEKSELAPWTKRADDYEIQIRFTRINRKQDGKIYLKTYDYRVNEKEYFYPASIIKMPVAIMALQKMNELADTSGVEINLDSPVKFTENEYPHTNFVWDSVTGSLPTFRHLIEQLFSVSDNNASNRLFEFTGPQYLNSGLYEKGAFTQSRIIHRVGVSGYKPDDHKILGKITFADKYGNLIYELENRKDSFNAFPKIYHQQKGRGYINDNDSLVLQPFDFSQKNYMSIRDMEAVLQRIIIPENFPISQRFNLKKEDYDFLKACMEKTPRHYEYLKRDTHYYDGYVKYYFEGEKSDTIPADLHILNKVGWAYGYLTDCSYIKYDGYGIEYFLTAAIKVNEDGIFNDGVYEYETIGLPFFKTLNKLIIQKEIERKSKKNDN